MSLVAYDASSDEDSDSEQEYSQVVVLANANTKKQQQQQPTGSKHIPVVEFDGHISDEDEDFTPAEVGLHQLKKHTLSLPPPKTREAPLTLSQEQVVVLANANAKKQQQQQPTGSKSSPEVEFDGHISDEDDDFTPAEVGLHQLKNHTLSLPPPKTREAPLTLNQELEEYVTPTFAKLPMPRSSNSKNTELIEEDDEFLHKKSVLLDDEQKPKPLPPTAANKASVKITIPALKEFNDVDKELAQRAKNKTGFIQAPKGSSLLSILPKAKSEQVFNKTSSSSTPIENPNIPSQTNVFVPDSVKNRRPAQNTEGVDGLRAPNKKPPTTVAKPKPLLVDCSDSDDASDTETKTSGDFFSLNSTETLPQVSANEINCMVAQRAAKMAKATNTYLNSMGNSTKAPVEEQATYEEEIMLQAQKRYRDQQNLDDHAMQTLVGGGAKRRRKHQQEIQVMDISSEQVLPDRDEWMRTALATSTTYQATGVLVDEEPASGTRRKHQITYLAHKAKANEAELQAMWAANRQTRRATQSKYGF